MLHDRDVDNLKSFVLAKVRHLKEAKIYNYVTPDYLLVWTNVRGQITIQIVNDELVYVTFKETKHHWEWE